ncbi:sugar kinase [Dactylosporangium sp. NPDC000244]|uniref:sugar kinase n=1 Tax=Dactylosporangium sp. NPDC000244 TaxID=3154365 RepID=UPI0033330393
MGETMAQLSATPPESLADARHLALDVAGAESTVALYLAHLGHPVAWVSRVGLDPFGTRIEALLRAAGVDTSWVTADPGRPTGVYFKDPAPGGTAVHYYRAGSAASAMTPATVPDDLRAAVHTLHITGITPALSDTCAAMTLSLMDPGPGRGYTVSFDVNYRAALWRHRDASGELLRLANLADVVFVGLDEARLLWGSPTAREVRTLIDAPAELIVKDGGVGATAFVGADEVFEPAVPVEVTEPVGAGDSFAAGYLHERLRGTAPRGRIQTAHRLAAAVLRTTADFVPPATTLGPA